MPCCQSKGPLKHGILDIYLTIFLGAVFPEIHKLGGTSFFGKCLKFNIDFKNEKKKKIEKKFFVFQIVAAEFIALNCLY